MIGSNQIGKLIQCHIDCGEPETFVVGILLAYDDEWFLMKDVSSYGEGNGFALYKKSDLVSVEVESDYLDKIAFLMRFNNTMWPDLRVSDNSLLIQVIHLCYSGGTVVGIETYASGFRDINGIIEGTDRNIVIIRQIDEYGRHDGVCWLDINSITRIFFNDKESTYLGILFQHYAIISECI